MNQMESMSFLDAEPFTAILEKRLAELQQIITISDPNTQLAHEVELGVRTILRLIKRQQVKISFDNADKIVTRILGPMAWYEDEELNRIYESVDLTMLDWAFPVSEKVKETLRETASKFVKELGTSAKAAQALGVSVGTIGRYAREARCGV